VHRRQVAASAVTEQKHTAFLEEAKKPSGEPADISQLFENSFRCEERA
jgi:hypothetical protein